MNDERRSPVKEGAALDVGQDDGRPEIGSPDPVHEGESAGSSDAARCPSGGRRYARYFEWIRAVRDAPPETLPGRVKGTLLILATYADPDGRRMKPSLRTLGSKLGKSDDAVGRDLRIAYEAGFLDRWRPSRDSQFHYRLTLPLEPAPAWVPEPAPVWEDLLRGPTQTKTPTASSSRDLPLDEYRGAPSDDGAPLDDPSTNGDETMKTSTKPTLDYGPTALDESLALGDLTLDDLPIDVRDRTVETYGSKTGRAIVNYCAKASRGDTVAFAELLDDERLLFSVADERGHSYPRLVDSADEAADEIRHRHDRGARRVTLRAIKGDEVDALRQPF
jgi:hypothetical protein